MQPIKNYDPITFYNTDFLSVNIDKSFSDFDVKDNRELTLSSGIFGKKERMEKVVSEIKVSLEEIVFKLKFQQGLQEPQKKTATENQAIQKFYVTKTLMHHAQEKTSNEFGQAIAVAKPPIFPIYNLATGLLNHKDLGKHADLQKLVIQILDLAKDYPKSSLDPSVIQTKVKEWHPKMKDFNINNEVLVWDTDKYV